MSARGYALWGLLLTACAASAEPPMPPTPAHVAATAERWLSRAAGAGGGFGYTTAGMAFTAPTALAVIALEPGPVRGRALEWLRAQQLPDGSWPVCDGDSEGSWMTAPAVLALALNGSKADFTAVASGREWLLGKCEASRGPQKPAAGWPWTPGTAPWVEPTAWALLALAPAGPLGKTGEARVTAAVGYLVNEVNREGGWSLYDARPFPYHTALVLMALDSLPTMRLQAAGLRPAQLKAQEFLRGALTETSPVLDLAWGLWALSEGIPELSQLARASRWLAARQRSDGSFESSPWLTAAAIAAIRALYGKDELRARKGAAGG